MRSIAPFLLVFLSPIIAILLISFLFFRVDKSDFVVNGKLVIEGQLVVPKGRALVIHRGSEIVFRDGILICYGTVYTIGDSSDRIKVSGP